MLERKCRNVYGAVISIHSGNQLLQKPSRFGYFDTYKFMPKLVLFVISKYLVSVRNAVCVL